ncbi:DUF4190 domain-containing protein [Evansella sp. AB-rgal1]|uniref:DUF4190 domain-containing protein n=1 Tax=Evansella sp. AB-rgal1 TaxID=3242696 RepID=UPI00359D8749
MDITVKTNSNSVLSLIMGLLSILLPLIGIVFGVFGLITSRKSIKEIEKTREVGRNLATSGFICSSVGIVIQLFAVLVLIAIPLLRLLLA